MRKGVKSKKLLITLISISTIIVAMAIATIIYCNDYSRAEDSVNEYLVSSDDVYVEHVVNNELNKEYYVFKPTSTINCGFMFYPGGKVEYTAYAPMLYKLAEEGILCICPKMPANLAILKQDMAKDLTELYPQVSKWYIGGHSLGGVCAAFYLEDNYNDYEGLILLASYSSVDLSNTTLDVLSIYGSNDTVLKIDEYNESLNNYPTLNEYVINGGIHAYMGYYGAQEGDGTATITRDSQQEQVINEIIDFVK